MADNLTPAQRKKAMTRVRSTDTKPEMTVRRMVHAMGFRFRLHRKDLPGKPDLVLPRHKKIIFVHGCFWHVHEGCPGAKTPAANPDYWIPKLERNRQRDKKIQQRLMEAGWDVLVVWECQTKNGDLLKGILKDFLEA